MCDIGDINGRVLAEDCEPHTLAMVDSAVGGWLDRSPRDCLHGLEDIEIPQHSVGNWSIVCWSHFDLHR